MRFKDLPAGIFDDVLDTLEELARRSPPESHALFCAGSARDCRRGDRFSAGVVEPRSAGGRARTLQRGGQRRCRRL